MGIPREAFATLGVLGVARVGAEHLLERLGVRKPVNMHGDFAASSTQPMTTQPMGDTWPMVFHPDGSPVDNFLKAHPAKAEAQGPVAPH